MARVFPDDYQVADNENRFSSEIRTLLRLKGGLSNQYCVFHGSHWTKFEDDGAIYGEN
jgi:hypothetical protein